MTSVWECIHRRVVSIRGLLRCWSDGSRSTIVVPRRGLMRSCILDKTMHLTAISRQLRLTRNCAVKVLSNCPYTLEFTALMVPKIWTCFRMWPSCEWT